MSKPIAYAYRDNREAARIQDRRLAQLLDKHDDYTVSWVENNGDGE